MNDDLRAHHQPDTQEYWINVINLRASGWTEAYPPSSSVPQLPPPGYTVLQLPPPNHSVHTETLPPAIMNPYVWPPSVAIPPSTGEPPATPREGKIWCLIVGAIFTVLLVSSMVSMTRIAPATSWVDQVPTTNGTWNVPCLQSTPSDNGNPYAIVGKPDLSVEFVNRVLSHYHSPVAGDGQKLIDATSRCGIKVGAALAFFMHESTLGTKGEATSTHSLGNMRCVKAIKQMTCVDQDRGGYAQMPDWATGFVFWSRMMRNQYVDQWGLVTIDHIILTYAPNADHNSEFGYISSWKQCIDAWHKGVV